MKKYLQYSILCIALIFSLISCKKDKSSDPVPAPVVYSNFIKVESEYVVEADEVQAFFQGMAGNDINLAMFGVIWKPLKVVTIRYKTTDEHNLATEASGIVSYFVGADSYRGLYSIQHGTCDFANAPSKLRISPESFPVVLNYVVSMSDYLGYGLSEKDDHFHPYLNTDNTASVCYDMMIAAKEYLSSISLNPGNDEKVNLIGYSQGGAATVALQEKIESLGKYTLDKVYAGGAPLNLVETFNYLIENFSHAYYHPAYYLLIINSMNKSYDLNLDFNKIFTPDFVNVLDLLKDYTFDEIDSILGSDMHVFCHEDMFAPDFNNNTEINRLYDSYEKNNLLADFQPKTPLLLYHSLTDEQVPYINAQLASQTYNNCIVKNLDAHDHYNGAIEFYFRALMGGIK